MRRFKYNPVALKLIFFPMMFPAIATYCQSYGTPDQKAYIEKYKGIAIQEMRLFHIPASITLAQGIIESNSGKSPLATEANNHFGIKCHKDWQGSTFHYDDDEKQECFRKYPSAEESFRDHSLFLKNRQRYAALFSLDSNDYTGWAMGLKQAGYATNPDYPQLLIKMIEGNILFIYDRDATEAKQAIAVKSFPGDSVELLPVQRTIYGAEGRILFLPNTHFPKAEKFDLIRISSAGRPVYENNGIPFIFCEKEDTWAKVAKEFGIYAFQVYKDNDLSIHDPLTPGQMLYLEPKKRNADAPAHKVKPGDTLYAVAQLYGVKLKFLCKLNQLTEMDELKPGAILILHH